MTQLFVDKLADGTTVVTAFDALRERWTTAIIGGPHAGWETTYRAEEDPAAKHATAITLAHEGATP